MPSGDHFVSAMPEDREALRVRSRQRRLGQLSAMSHQWSKEQSIDLGGMSLGVGAHGKTPFRAGSVHLNLIAHLGS